MALQDFPDDFQALASIDWGTQLDDAQVADGVVRIKFLPGEGRTAWTAYEKNRVMKALEEFSDVIPIEFQKVNDPRKADFKVSKYADRDDPTLGFMNPPGEELEGVGSFNALGAGWDSKKGKGSTLEKGGYEFYTLIHEFAHGLGLAHPHDDGGESEVMTGVADPEDLGVWDLNQGVYTAMSYNRGLATGEGATTYRFWTYGHQSGPGAIDIAALQMKYGANLTHAAGDDVYVVPDQNRRGTYWETIWDTAGEDEIRYNGTRPATIDLRAATLTDNPGGGGFLSQSEPARGGFTIAYNVEIENGTGGAGDDHIRGNDLDNVIKGRGANDRLIGGRGDDVVNGHAGHDALIGGAGDDRLRGGAGNDSLDGGVGADRMKAGAGFDSLIGGRGGDRMAGGGGDDDLKGGGGADRIKGGAGDDRLKGGRGDDLLVGGEGDDAMTGGDGADLFRFGLGDGAGRDVIADFETGLDAIELVNLTADYARARFGAVLTLVETGGEIEVRSFDGAALSEDDLFV